MTPKDQTVLQECGIISVITVSLLPRVRQWMQDGATGAVCEMLGFWFVVTADDGIFERIWQVPHPQYITTRSRQRIFSCGHQEANEIGYATSQKHVKRAFFHAVCAGACVRVRLMSHPVFSELSQAAARCGSLSNIH